MGLWISKKVKYEAFSQLTKPQRKVENQKMGEKCHIAKKIGRKPGKVKKKQSNEENLNKKGKAKSKYKSNQRST